MMKTLQVLDPGPLTTVQDLGRAGLAELGVGRSGAADRGALRLANRLVGNTEDAAALEITGGGLRVHAEAATLVAVTGAPCPLKTSGGGSPAGVNAPFWLSAGATLELHRPAIGLRSYLAVRGGIAVDPVLGSRSTDTLSGLGPPPLRAGDRIPVGDEWAGPIPPVDVVPVSLPPKGEAELRIVAGPRVDWFAASALDVLCSSAYEVRADSDRVGMRLAGPELHAIRHDELPSEGMVPGAVQVARSGAPVLFLADHPVTGGYPVLAVVLSADVDRAAQAAPGSRLRFRRVALPSL
jgi:biotin-dependent carboxylase-like uncharacterized protein